MLPINNHLKEGAGKLIDRYARRILIENGIADAFQLFHMDTVLSAVPLKVDVDLQVTLMASSPYRLLSIKAGGRHEPTHAPALLRKFVQAVAQVVISEERIVVWLGRRANNPSLIRAGFAGIKQPIPWLGNKTLHFVFG